MSGYKNVAVAAATGNLGPALVKELVDAGLNVTVLSRTDKAANLPSGVKVVKVDYSSQESLRAALEGQEAFVALVPDHGSQPPLIDAAIAAGVQRFIPSEFGCDVAGNAKARGLPVFAGKAKTQEYLRSKQGQISYTLIANGVFLDWGVQVGFIASPKGGKTRIYDGGDRAVSATTLSDVGKAVVGVLRHPEETKNRAVYVQSSVITQNKLLEFIKKKDPSVKFEIEHVDTAELEKSGYETLGKADGDIGQAMVGFVTVGLFRDGYGSLFAKNDNELLGIKALSDSEVEAIVAQYV